MADKGLFACNRSRLDIQLAIEFMCNRVKDPDKYGYYKLINLMQHLQGTRYTQMRLRVDNTNIIKWYNEASHAVQNGTRGHI